jgi:hypothetical protein
LHDRLISIAFAADSDKRMLKFELILYRESKYQGKHVACTVAVQGGNVTFLRMKVIGVISSDSFGLFPVTGVDELAYNYSKPL